ncbi:MAG: hypothetical protein ACRCZD_18200 [Phycicoccus sp.]
MNFTVISRVSTTIGCVLVALLIWDEYDDDLSTPWVIPAVWVCLAVTLVCEMVRWVGSRSGRE